ncbi:PEP-CTERM sorting domain-containing protein [Maioricimonas rarisocia]|nr:PEP-CTERM sorting domain-containing protein [Maioricimonas rarisocia]
MCFALRIAKYSALVLLIAPAKLQAGLMPTYQDFDSPGTTYVEGRPGYTSGGILAGGPTGNFMRLRAADVPDDFSPNSIAFDRTAEGDYVQVVASFDFSLTPVTGSADGFFFTLLPTSEYGITGAAPVVNWAGGGAAEPRDLEHTFALGFDIFDNNNVNPNPPEPNNNHISLHYDKNFLGVFDPGFNLDSGGWHSAEVILNRVAGGTSLTLTLTPAGGSPVTPISDFLIGGYELTESRLAMGASTGGESALHDFDNISAQFTAVPEPGSFALLATALVGLAGYDTRRKRMVRTEEESESR